MIASSICSVYVYIYRLNVAKPRRRKRAETDFSNHRRPVYGFNKRTDKRETIILYIYILTAAVYILIKNQPHSASPARNTLTRARVPIMQVYTLFV